MGNNHAINPPTDNQASKKVHFSETQLKNLAYFLDKNAAFEITHLDLSNAEVIKAYNWQKLKSQQDEILVALRAYQRLKKIAPDLRQSTALNLLKAGVHSALQITAFPRVKFLREYAALFENDAIGVEQFYNQAASARTQILLHYIALKQANEPHINIARVQPKKPR